MSDTETHAVENLEQLSSGYYHHYLFFNCLDDERLLQDPSELQWVENPYPVSRALEAPKVDVFDDLLDQKARYLKEYELLKKDYANYSAYSEQSAKKMKCDTKLMWMPKFLVDVCDRGLSDPDPYFPNFNDYNWYYTGGVLDFFTRNGYSYLVRWNEVDGLSISDLFGLGSEYSLDRQRNSQIFAVKSYATDSDIFVTTRQENNVQVFRTNLSDGDNLELVLDMCKTHSECPFMDMKLNKFSFTSYATCDVNKQICIRDIGDEPIYKYNLHQDTGFCQLEYLSNDLLVIMDNSSVYLSDLRFSAMRKAALNLAVCESLCTFTASDNNYLYIASRHDVMKFDVRNFKLLYKYSHMMPLPPHLMTLTKTADEDLICLSNRNSRLLLHDSSSQHTLPINVPTIVDTYRDLKISGRGFLSSAAGRLESSTLGMTIVKDPEQELYIYTSNSCGDVFKQKILTEQIESNSQNELLAWLGTLPEKRTRVQVTNVLELSCARRVLNKHLRASNLAHMQRKGKSLVVPNLYQDGTNMYAKDLEAVWIEPEDIPEPDERLVEEVRPTTKVSAWLRSQDFKEVEHAQFVANWVEDSDFVQSEDLR